MLRAGEAGRMLGVKGEGDGFGGSGTEGWRGTDGTPDSGAGAVGVACGVEAAELALATEMGAGVCFSLRDEGWWYTLPNSPGEKVRAEQKPSDEVMRRVWPSLDHVRSVKVA